MTARRHILRGGIAAAVVALLGIGAGASWAYWSGNVTATSTAGAAQLAVGTSNFGTVAYTFGNDKLTTTASVSVTNSTTTASTRVPSLALAFSRSSGSADLAGDVGLTVWYQSNGTCTSTTAVGSGAVTGTWASFPGLSTTLAKGATSVFCIRSTIADRQDAASSGGSLSFVPAVSATLTVGNFAASAAATASAQGTQYIYPFTTLTASTWYMVQSSGMCMDVNGGGTSSGTTVISYACKSSGTENQEWMFTRDGTTGYYDIRPRNATGLRLDVNGATTAGTPTTVRTDASTTGQLWQPQLVSAGTYQFVNKLTGFCLTSTATSAGAVTQAVCDGGADQKHTLTTAGSGGSGTPLQNFACVDYDYSTSVGLSWTTSSGGPYTAQSRRTSSGSWAAVSTPSGQWSDSVQVTAGSLPSGGSIISWGNGSYAVRVIDGSGSVVGTSNVTVYTASWGTKYVRCT